VDFFFFDKIVKFLMTEVDDWRAVCLNTGEQEVTEQEGDDDDDVDEERQREQMLMV
jgi:hypothetical protein